jgi:hypothetical protein
LARRSSKPNEQAALSKKNKEVNQHRGGPHRRNARFDVNGVEVS